MFHRNPHEIEFIENDPQGSDGSLQDLRVGGIEGISFLFQQLAGHMCFSSTPLGKIDVSPSREEILLIPYTLSMSQQDQLNHTSIPLIRRLDPLQRGLNREIAADTVR